MNVTDLPISILRISMFVEEIRKNCLAPRCGTIGREYFMEVEGIAERDKFIYVMQTNRMILGRDHKYVHDLLKNYCRHVHLSKRGDILSQSQFWKL